MREMRRVCTYRYTRRLGYYEIKNARCKPMTYYVVCPERGYKLLKAGDGSTIEIYCPKCKGKYLIAVKDGKVTVQKATVDNK